MTDTTDVTDLQTEVDRLNAEVADLRGRLAINQANAASPGRPVRKPNVISKSEAANPATLAAARAAAKRLGTELRILPGDIPSPDALKRLKRSTMEVGQKVIIVAAYGRETFMSLPLE